MGVALGFGPALGFGVGKTGLGALGVLRAVRDWRPVRYAELHNGLPSSLNPSSTLSIRRSYKRSRWKSVKQTPTYPMFLWMLAYASSPSKWG